MNYVRDVILSKDSLIKIRAIILPAMKLKSLERGSEDSSAITGHACLAFCHLKKKGQQKYGSYLV